MELSTICTAVAILILIVLGLVSKSAEASKYLAQRDALLNLLDSEGRGQEALQCIKRKSW